MKRNTLLWTVLTMLAFMEGSALTMVAVKLSGTPVSFFLAQAYAELLIVPGTIIFCLVIAYIVRRKLLMAHAATSNLVVLTVLMARSPEERSARRRERAARLTHGMGLLVLILLAMIAFGGIASAAAASNGADLGGMVGVFLGGFLLFGMLAAIVWASARATRHIRLLHMHVLDARGRHTGKAGRKKSYFGRRKREERE